MGRYLDSNYIIPRSHRSSNPKAFDDNSFLLLFPDDKGTLTIESETSIFKIEKPEDISKAFPSKYNWVNSNNSEIDCLFKVLPIESIRELLLKGETFIGLSKLVWIQGKVSYVVNNNSKDTRFLSNVSIFMKEKVNTQDFSFLKEVFSELDLLNNLGISINLISPTATLTDLILNEITEPFEVINSIPVNYLRYLHMGFIGPRMETLSLGNLGQASVVDMDKAFLRELAFVPSLRKRNIRQVVKGSNTFYEDSHPGSVYTIQVEIPSSYSSFAPIPQRLGEHIRYPIGFIESTIVSKLYVERLIKDRVPFKILDSLQVRLRSQDTTDFSSFSDRVIQVENCLKGLKYINPKMLHYSLVGSMLAIHREIKDSIIYVASRNYNPLIANTIQARVAMKSWEKSITELSEVIAVDSVIGKELVVTPGWTSKGTGETLIVTPYVKDKGGSSKYRTLLNNYRDSFSFPLSFPNRRLSLKECARTPKKTGTLENSICHIAPSGQGRLPTLQIKKLGYLLDHKVSTVIPNAQDPIGEVFELPEWLLKTGGV